MTIPVQDALLGPRWPPFSGSIEMILGPMFSGKTTELLRRINRYVHGKCKCILIKPRIDFRYTTSDGVVTHDRVLEPALTCTELDGATAEAIVLYDVIGIDEGQFFQGIAGFAEQQANLGKIVIIAALDGTYERQPFANILAIIPLAENVIKLSAVCPFCSSDAAFSFRTTQQTDLIVVGGDTTYQATCRRCFHDLWERKTFILSLPPGMLTDSDIQD